MENGVPLRGGDDGHCGPYTVQSIKKFQLRFMRNPDGRVDAGGRTWERLTSGISPSTPNVGTSASATALTPVVTPSNNEAINANLTELFLIMEYIARYSLRTVPNTTSPKLAEWLDWNNRGDFITRARNRVGDWTTVGKQRETPIALCASYVKVGLAAAQLVSGYMPGASAQDMGSPLQDRGFTNVMAALYGDEPRIFNTAIPKGAVIVYRGGADGHIEIWSGRYFMSDFITEVGRTSDNNTRLPKHGRYRTVIGIWVKN
jgi:peptidoglycan hydrolase-like protein with peptidoglycan-binding domain